MIKTALLTAALCVCFSTLTHACPSANQTLQHLDYLEHVKRWYSVGNPAPDEPPIRISWPVLKPAEGSFSAYQPLRYCWKTQSSYDNLNGILQAAIAKWQPAMAVSALQIVPDTGVASRLCDDPQAPAADDAYEIEDLSEIPGMEGVKAASTMGYRPLAAFAKSNPRVSPRQRHGLSMRSADTPKGGTPGPLDVRTMTHELGHGIGLYHEHSRHDREDFVWFFCENLFDYNAMKARLPQYPGVTAEKACSDARTAAKLRFSAVHWLPDGFDGILGMLQWSKSFDYDSIMNYNSDAAAIGAKFPDQAVLVGHKPGQGNKATKEGGFEFFEGGSKDPAQAKISQGDIARIAQLYPAGQPHGEQVAAQTSWAPTSWGFKPKPQAKRTAIPDLA